MSMTLLHTHTHTMLKNGPMDYAPKRSLAIYIIRRCDISAVSPLFNVLNRDRVKLVRIVLTDTQYEGNVLT